MSTLTALEKCLLTLATAADINPLPPPLQNLSFEPENETLGLLEWVHGFCGLLEGIGMIGIPLPYEEATLRVVTTTALCIFNGLEKYSEDDGPEKTGELPDGKTEEELDEALTLACEEGTNQYELNIEDLVTCVGRLFRPLQSARRYLIMEIAELEVAEEEDLAHFLSMILEVVAPNPSAESTLRH